MCHFKIVFVVSVLFIILGHIEGKISQDLSRHKRTSDQRLAELETLIALSKMNGKLVTIPIGFGKIDPNKIGRRKRSVSFLLQQLMKDISKEADTKEEITSSETKRKDGGQSRRQDGGGEDESDGVESERISLFEQLQLMRRPHLLIKLPE